MVEQPPASAYMAMQKEYYARCAGPAKYDQEVKEEDVVGSYHAHNDWADYDRYIMRHIDASYKDKLAIEFGCGPGRNIIRWHHLFKRLDGCDLAEKNLENARINLDYHGVPVPNLHLTTGNDMGQVQSNTYDFLFSTICMQHICVHSIRYDIMRHWYRVLRKGGRISVQMGFGNDAPQSVGYYENNTGARATNRGCDTRVENPDYLEKDLVSLGFKDFDYWVRPTGPGDTHPYWIYFTALK